MVVENKINIIVFRNYCFCNYFGNSQSLSVRMFTDGPKIGSHVSENIVSEVNETKDVVEKEVIEQNEVLVGKSNSMPQIVPVLPKPVEGEGELNSINISDIDDSFTQGRNVNPSNGGGRNVESSGMSSSFISDINFNNFEIYLDSLEMSYEISNRFDNMALINNRYRVVNSNMSHLKNRLQRDRLSRDESLFVRVSLRSDFADLYNNAVWSAFNDPKPANENYMRGIQLGISSRDNLLRMPIFQLLPEREYTVGKTAYALSHGLRDLHHFMPCSVENMKFDFQYSSRLDTDMKNKVKLELSSSGKTILESDSDMTMMSYNIGPEANVLSLYNNNSIFDKSKYLTFLNTLYEISGTIEIEFNIESVTERVGVNVRTQSGGVTFSDAFRTVSNDVNLNTVSINDIQLTELLTPMFHLRDIRMSKNDNANVIEYVATALYFHIKKHISVIPGATITIIKSNLNITKKLKGSSLHNLYKTSVHSGIVVPMSPLQYRLYFDDVSWDVWRYYAFLASISNVRINSQFESLMPYMNSNSITNMVMYARNVDTRSTQYYEGTPLLPFQEKQNYSLSYEMFLKEMFTRTVLQEEIPDFYENLSKGLWKGSQAGSYLVSPATLNPVICKFGLDDEYSHSTSFINRILLMDNGYRPPVYASSQIRLSESLPNIYSRYLPISGIESLDVLSIEEADTDADSE